MGWNLAVRLLSRLRPAAEVVAQFVRSEIARGEPSTRFDPDHLEPSLRKREGSDASNRPEADDDDVGLLQFSGHDHRPS